LALAFTSIGTGAFIAKTGQFLPPIYMGFILMTIGYGLFINFDADSSLAKIILYQVVAGFGIGPLFQAPTIALQAHINPRDIATATATLGFIRQLATSTSVVIGQVVFQNEMNKKIGTLTAALGAQLAQRLSGAAAGANVGLIDSLPADQRTVVRENFAWSLQPMWIMYTAFSGVGILVVLLIRRKTLATEHQETKTGLAAEKENAEARKAEKAAKRAEASPGFSKDVEKGAVPAARADS
jgi:MFS family permease